MELKLETYKYRDGREAYLLIVPYGIETAILNTFTVGFLLLIVPYGIETFVFCCPCFCGFYLLIVPYGIETPSCLLVSVSFTPF